MATVFLTGFPGFLGSELLPRILERAPGAQAVCLIQSKFRSLAEQRMSETIAENPDLEGRIELVEGDITAPGLGLETLSDLAEDTIEIFHLAAVYDLSVRREVGMKVNVEGTRNMLDFARQCPRLQRFQYVSTCYVSGRYAGIYSESDLIKGQTFNNYYEETKYLAEVDVQNAMAEGLPVTIYRPAIVVGDSKTGATQKYDGPYYVIRWLLKQPYLAFMPMVGDPKAVRVNLVPRDFVIDAITHLSALKESEGKVYHLADPEPQTVDELVETVAKATRRTVIRLPLLQAVAKAAIDHVPGVYRLMGIPAASIDYFVHPTHYTCFNTLEDLQGSGITAPPFPKYVNRLVAFVKGHPDVSSKAMT
ncbi:MAG: SDR family oxidoreductase [Deltaproteobacteria bacterium]|nr:SDR family oxidoreductase [Deltaproteobacteria bacterium]